ncbi:hypothetical protein H0H81_012155 [Sphagnurus paluster]|uniref:Uncharacterized protein n=1 Tax=Sphagnurus paluster TaxID=117069 RepID=A0A9P7K673_9AGAR|nr:hypothetical protein H0H81_012155 [Sphagnurus paluster]
MLSIRTVFKFVCAVTTFASLVSAAPHRASEVAEVLNVVPSGTTLKADPSSVGFPNVVAPSDTTAKSQEGLLSKIVEGIDILSRHDSDILSLYEILVEVDHQLIDLYIELTTVIDTKIGMQAQAVVDIIARAKFVLDGALVDAESIIGQPTDSILSHNRKTLCGLFTCALRGAGTASSDVVHSAVSSASIVFAELLGLILILIDGLYEAVLPFRSAITDLCDSAKLHAVVEVLNGKS